MPASDHHSVTVDGQVYAKLLDIQARYRRQFGGARFSINQVLRLILDLDTTDGKTIRATRPKYNDGGRRLEAKSR